MVDLGRRCSWSCRFFESGLGHSTAQTQDGRIPSLGSIGLSCRLQEVWYLLAHSISTLVLSVPSACFIHFQPRIVTSLPCACLVYFLCDSQAGFVNPRQLEGTLLISG